MFFGGLWCLLHLPPAGAPSPCPFLLFLHGAGERGAVDGSQLCRVGRHGPWRAQGADNWVILAPQCPCGKTWPEMASRVAHLARLALRRGCGSAKWRCRIDRSSCTLTGLSMGGLRLLVCRLSYRWFVALCDQRVRWFLPATSEGNASARRGPTGAGPGHSEAGASRAQVAHVVDPRRERPAR